MSSSQSSLQFPIRKSSRTTRTVRKLFYGDDDDATTTTPKKELKRSTRQALHAKTGGGRAKTVADKSVRIPFSPIKPDFPNQVASSLEAPTAPTHTSPIRKLDFSDAERTPTKSLRASPKKNGSPLKRLQTPSKQSNLSFTPSKRGSPMKAVHSIVIPPTSTAPASPRKPARDYGVCYQRAKQCLHTSQPERGMVGRQQERKALKTFLDTHLVARVPGCLYISGPPGTGKSALLIETITQYSDFHVISANCMTLHRAEHIYNKLLKDFVCTSDYSALSTRQAMQQLQKHVTSKGKMILMVLDEIDQLDTKTQEVLYTLFEWPSLNKSRLVLVGIANSLDLTDRVLPRLQARTQCLPTLLQFAPYTRDQLAAIIEDRLVEVMYHPIRPSEASVDGDCVMEPASIQFAARKVAALAGDVRKALDICRAAVELVQTSTRQSKRTVVIPTVVPSSPHKTLVHQQKRVGLADIMKVINRSTQNAIVSKEAECTFPLQQKFILCTLALMLRSHVSGKRQQILLGNLHTAYCKIADKRHVTPVDQSEFISLLDLIEARGIIRCKKNNVIRSSRITLNLNEKDLQFALSDNKLMSSIMSEGITK